MCAAVIVRFLNELCVYRRCRSRWGTFSMLEIGGRIDGSCAHLSRQLHSGAQHLNGPRKKMGKQIRQRDAGLILDSARMTVRSVAFNFLNQDASRSNELREWSRKEKGILRRSWSLHPRQNSRNAAAAAAATTATTTTTATKRTREGERKNGRSNPVWSRI